MRVEETLQYQYGSHLIDHLAVPGKGAPGGVEVAMGFGRSQALVPQVDGQREGGAEGVRERLGSLCLGADVTGHIQRVTEDDGRALVFAEEAGEGLQVGFDIFAHQSQNRLGGESQLVGDGDTDAASSEIEAEKARRHSRMVARRSRQAGGKIGILQ